MISAEPKTRSASGGGLFGGAHKWGVQAVGLLERPLEAGRAGSVAGSRPGPSLGLFSRHMILYRHAHSRFPFFGESTDQLAARRHGAGEAPVHYFADPPDGAWAEFVRPRGNHRRVSQRSPHRVGRRGPGRLSPKTPRARARSADRWSRDAGSLTKGRGALRPKGAKAQRAPSPALLPGGAQGGWKVDRLLRAVERVGIVLAIFRPRPDVVGWTAAFARRPPSDQLIRVRHSGTPEKGSV